MRLSNILWNFNKDSANVSRNLICLSILYTNEQNQEFLFICDRKSRFITHSTINEKRPSVFLCVIELFQALVNQVAATIYARFHRKKLPEGRTVFGVFTRDYRDDILNSQVTIFVLFRLSQNKEYSYTPV